MDGAVLPTKPKMVSMAFLDGYNGRKERAISHNTPFREAPRGPLSVAMEPLPVRRLDRPTTNRRLRLGSGQAEGRQREVSRPGSVWNRLPWLRC